MRQGKHAPLPSLEDSDDILVLPLLIFAPKENRGVEGGTDDEKRLSDQSG
jgi:hypothetical protein